jgi:hypothetical protein
MTAQELGHELIHPPGRGLPEDPGRDASAPDRGQLAHAVGGVLDRAQAARRVLGEGTPRVGYHYPASGADEEIGTERLFQPANLLRDRGLGDAQCVGGGREGAELERGAEAAELLERQKLSLRLRQAVKPSLTVRRPRSLVG